MAGGSKGPPLARKKQKPVSAEDRRAVGALLRDLRRGAGFRAVQDVTEDPRCPAARQTIYAYERGGLLPSLLQFLELVEFYALKAGPREKAKPRVELRSQAVAAIATALTMPCYHFAGAVRLMERLRPAPIPKREGRRRAE
jgi:hypothetical protein